MEYALPEESLILE